MKYKLFTIMLLTIIISGCVSVKVKENLSITQRNQVYLNTLDSISNFRDYHTVNWESYQAEGRPYPCDVETGNINKELFEKAENENAAANYCDMWLSIANARDDFYAKTAKIRVIASAPVLGKVNNLEQGFNDVFTELLKDFYGRAFIDHYDDIMQKRFTELEQAMRLDILDNK